MRRFFQQCAVLVSVFSLMLCGSGVASSADASRTISSAVTRASSLSQSSPLITGRAALNSLVLRDASGPKYQEGAFEYPIVGADRCTTREHVIVTKAPSPVLSSPCTVLKAMWNASWDAHVIEDQAEVDVDQTLPLEEAWYSGAWAWTPKQRRDFANDLYHEISMSIMTPSMKAERGASDPAKWWPPVTGYRCHYAMVWVWIKTRWNLSVDRAEYTALMNELDGGPRNPCRGKEITIPPLGLSAGVGPATIAGGIGAPDETVYTSMRVQAYRADTPGRSPVKETNIRSDGDFELTGLPAGAYILKFLGGTSGTNDQWYSEWGPGGLPTTITLTPGGIVSGIRVGMTASPTAAGAFQQLPPTRFLDTRPGSPVAPDGSVSFQVAGINGIPADAAAVVFNLTVTQSQSFGYITAYASGTRRPGSSNVNFDAGQTIPNSVTVPIGADGKVTLLNRSSGTTELIVDVSGYYLAGTATAAGTFQHMAPARFLDTRPGSPVAPDGSVSFQVAGINGIPTDAAAVVFNLTVTQSQSFGYITAYASGTRRPGSSNVNFDAGQTIPNSVTVPIGADGKVTLLNRSSGTTELIVDVSGYYLAGTATAAGTFQHMAPARFLDTRPGSPVAPDGSVSFQVAGINGIPTDAAAVVFNLTVTQSQSFGYITAYASGTRRPGSSNVNFDAGQTIPNSVTLPIGADGKVTLVGRSSGTAELIVDVSGYYLASTGSSK